MAQSESREAYVERLRAHAPDLMARLTVTDNAPIGPFLAYLAHELGSERLPDRISSYSGDLVMGRLQTPALREYLAQGSSPDVQWDARQGNIIREYRQRTLGRIGGRHLIHPGVLENLPPQIRRDQARYLLDINREHVDTGGGPSIHTTPEGEGTYMPGVLVLTTWVGADKAPVTVAYEESTDLRSTQAGIIEGVMANSDAAFYGEGSPQVDDCVQRFDEIDFHGMEDTNIALRELARVVL